MRNKEGNVRGPCSRWQDLDSVPQRRFLGSEGGEPRALVPGPRPSKCSGRSPSPAQEGYGTMVSLLRCPLAHSITPQDLCSAPTEWLDSGFLKSDHCWDPIFRCPLGTMERTNHKPNTQLVGTWHNVDPGLVIFLSCGDGGDGVRSWHRAHEGWRGAERR